VWAKSLLTYLLSCRRGCGEQVLRPFLLRRLKTEVEKGLPPKKEIILKVGLTDMQRQYYKMLLQKDFDAINGTGERSRLLNVVMQVSRSFIRHKAPRFPPPHISISVYRGALSTHISSESEDVAQ
jgi:SNF2 family DNA or RNA helicase